LGGIFALRIYESALVRQTESELIAQGAFVSATYRSLATHLANRHDVHGHAGDESVDGEGLPLQYHPQPGEADGPWQLRNPKLDLATDAVLPPPPSALAAGNGDALAIAIGKELNPILRDAQLYTLSGIRVVDQNGIVVASTGEGDELGRSLMNRDEVVRALRGEPVSVLRRRSSEVLPLPLDSISRGAHIRVFVVQPIVRGDRVLGAVVLVRTPANLKQALIGKRSALMEAGLILFAVVLALSLLTSLTISRPVHALIAQARRAARGETGAVVPLRHPVTQEIAELSDTVAAMASTLEARARYINDFATHVSHEFKTPLTAIRGSVELLRDHGATMSAEERERFLGLLDADAARLEKLVRRLLELARADMVKPGSERSELRVVIDGVAARYRELGMSVEVGGSTGTAPIAMSAETLDSILHMLLDNARQHAGREAQVTIGWQLEAGGRCLALNVGDNGPGISPGNIERVFEPFFTTARERGGTGLGLAIIRALLKAHGGDIALGPSVHGASFRLTLPLAPGSPA
jgi:signal transduction histidine kinase